MTMKSPEEVIKMVEGCSTEDLEKLSKDCAEKQKKGFSLYLAMIHLAIDHELTNRNNLSKKEVKT
jgi:hypothetical protein